MQPQPYFFVSIGFAFIAWAIVAKQYVWPRLRLQQRTDALRPLLVLHTFRFVGLAFLIPGAVSPSLPSVFAHSAAYGDLIAAILAMLALATLRSQVGVAMVWIFNLWGSADILNAFYQANHAALVPGQLGVAYYLPTFVVPLLLITHGLIFRVLLRHQSKSVLRRQIPRPA